MRISGTPEENCEVRRAESCISSCGEAVGTHLVQHKKIWIVTKKKNEAFKKNIVDTAFDLPKNPNDFCNC